MREEHGLQARQVLAEDLNRLGIVLHDQARMHARVAARLARDTNMAHAAAASQNTIGTIHLGSDRHEEAIAAFTAALSLCAAAKLDFVHVEALIGLALANAHLDAGAQARSHAVAAIAHTRRAGYRVLEGKALTALALVELRAGHVAAATAAVEQAVAVHAETGHREGVSRSREILADIEACPRAAKL